MRKKGVSNAELDSNIQEIRQKDPRMVITSFHFFLSFDILGS